MDTGASASGREQPPALLVPRRTLVRGALGFGAAATLAACARESNGARPTGSITVTDQRGKKHTFDGPVQRIVTIPMPAASIVMAVDQSAERLVGINDQSWVAVRDSVMASFFPEALDIEHGVARQDFAPNVESILALQPDLVVQWSNQGDGLIEPLENAGLKVLGVEYGTLDDIDVWLNLFATLLGKPDRGVAMTAHIGTAQARIAEEARAREGDRPRVLYFLRFAEQLMVAGDGTFNDEYIRLVGAENAAAEVSGFVEVDIEQVLRWDPDVMLLGNFDGAVPADLFGDRVWQSASAVREGRVYKVPIGGYRWDPPSQESPLMWRWLADLAFPTEEPSQLRASVADDYAFLYGASPTDAQIDTVLQIDANDASANYRQFHVG